MDETFKMRVREILGLTIGQASMSWDPIPSGTFDPSRALNVLDGALSQIVTEAQLALNRATREKITEGNRG